MKSRPMGGVEPPSAVAAAMQAVDAVLLQTGYSTLHTNAARTAVVKGVQICDMWGFDEDMILRGGITADYEEVKVTSERLGKLMAVARTARLTTPEGTDLTMTIRGRKIIALFGIARNRGEIAALPDGEAVVSPLEGSTTGVMVNPTRSRSTRSPYPRNPYGRPRVTHLILLWRLEIPVTGSGITLAGSTARSSALRVSGFSFSHACLRRRQSRTNGECDQVKEH